MNKVVQTANANEFTNVKNIKGRYLFTKDGYVFGYLQIFHYNLDLVSREEQRMKTDMIARSFDGDRKDFVYQSFPREVDLDTYKEFLKKKYQDELESVGRRRLLAEMILEAMDLSTSGDNYEHQHYIKLWKKIGSNVEDSIAELKERMNDFKERYEMAGIHAEILEYEQIIKLCNLYGNSSQISYDNVSSSSFYSPLTQIRGTVQ